MSDKKSKVEKSASDHYYDHELSSLEDNPGNLSQDYLDVASGKISSEEYRKRFEAEHGKK